MMPYVIHSAITDCCGECPSHLTGRVQINYGYDGYGNQANKSSDIIVKSYIDDETDVHFPIFGFQDQTHFAKYYGYIPIVSSAGVAFFVNKEGGAASPQNVASAVFSCWPLIMFNLILAFLVGLIVWLLVSVVGSPQVDLFCAPNRHVSSHSRVLRPEDLEQTGKTQKIEYFSGALVRGTDFWIKVWK